MFKTNTQQCWDTRNGKPSHGGSHGTHCDDCYDHYGNSPFANSSFLERVIKNFIFHLTIIKSGARFNQLNKVLKAISTIYQDKDYDYIPDIISSNTKPIQDYFLSDHLINWPHTFKHYVKQIIVDPIIRLDVPSGNIPTNPEMVENTPIYNSNPQDQQHINYMV